MSFHFKKLQLYVFTRGTVKRLFSSGMIKIESDVRKYAVPKRHFSSGQAVATSVQRILPAKGPSKKTKHQIKAGFDYNSHGDDMTDDTHARTHTKFTRTSHPPEAKARNHPEVECSHLQRSLPCQEAYARC